MIKSPGRCPICAEELERSGDLLVCPSGDYKADTQAFDSRWMEFLQEIKNVGPIAADSVSLIRDLKQMNQAKR